MKHNEPAKIALYLIIAGNLMLVVGAILSGGL